MVEAAPQAGKHPRRRENPESIFDLPMTWCLTRSDIEGAWSWGQTRQWSEDEWSGRIEPNLRLLTGMPWSEIERMSSGGHRRNHPQDVATLVVEVQDRWAEVGIETDVAYRFRLSGAERVWGFRVNAHFHLVWYDPDHRFYPTEMRHT